MCYSEILSMRINAKYIYLFRLVLNFCMENIPSAIIQNSGTSHDFKVDNRRGICLDDLDYGIEMNATDSRINLISIWSFFVLMSVTSSVLICIRETLLYLV